MATTVSINNERSNPWLWYALALLVIVLDQYSKHLATSLLEYNSPIVVLPVFNWTLHHNEGAAWGFLNDAGGWQRWFFIALSTIVSVVMAVWIARLPRVQWLLASALSLILGGAVGNLIDRARFGYVVDFIQVHWDLHYFPTFNVADAGITVGAALLILDMLLNQRDSE